jgi:nucleoside-diphosphate-sugar epimerase|tara:strand:- start:4313 stop:5266 length:954 start_codon:yes stop_codon:yes gene_type:complete
MERKKVLVTGGAGYLGNVLTRKLLDEGHQVTCLDNLMYRQKDSIFPLATNSDFEFVHGDVRDDRVLKDLVPKHDTIIPLAAIVGFDACKQEPYNARTTNQEAIELLGFIRSASQQLIFPNTNSGYGTKTGEVHCTEDTDLEPISLYGQTKCAAERSILESNMGGVVFRLASVFGISPRMRVELSFHDMVMQALTKRNIVVVEGNAKRNHVHISDIADGFYFAMEHYNKMQDQQVFNLGSDEANLSRMQLAKKVADYIPGTAISEDTVYEDPDKRDYIVSNERLKEAGFKAKTTVEQGIKEVTKGFSIMISNDADRNM